MSSVRNSTFIADSLFVSGSHYLRSHIHLQSVRGISIYNNQFKNIAHPTLTLVEPYLRGTGISANYSSFIAHGLTMYDSETGLGNNFEGLYYGIKASGNGTGTISIRYNTFTDNYRGIYMSSINAPLVAFNNITTSVEFYPAQVGEPFYTNQGLPSSMGVKYGAYLKSCSNFKFEKNTIQKGDAGLYIYNIGNAEGHEIFRNQFGDENKGIRAANVIIGKNSNFVQNLPGYTGDEGLQVRCNKYISNTNAISILNGNMRKNQGENSDETDKLAGNQFHKTLENAREFTVEISNNFSHFDLGTNVKYNYFQHDDSEASPSDLFYRELRSVENNKVNASTVRGVTFDEPLSCPSSFSSGTGAGSSSGNLAAVLAGRTVIISDQNEKHEELVSEYSKTVDKGDTGAMLKTAETMDDANYDKAYDILANSGYLSDKVYLAVIGNEKAPEAAKAAILIKNSPLPEKIVPELENSTMSKAMKDMVMKYQEGINSREILEYQMSDIKQEIARIELDMVSMLMNVGEFKDEYADSLINYFADKKQKSFESYRNIYNLQIEKGDTSAAQKTLSELMIYASTLESGMRNEINNYCDISSIYLNSIDNGIIDTAVLALSKETLLDAAISGSWMYSAQAQDLYSYLTDTVFWEPTPLPEEVPEELPEKRNTKTDISELFAPVFKIYPNPTNGMLFMEYDPENNYGPGYELLLKAIGKEYAGNCSNISVNISSMEGKILKNIEFEDGKTIKTIDINNFSNGIYIIEITDCYGNKTSKKITKQ
ncbi:T9SS type A sorting domain-containing protein [Bacteroidales bacterium OttesenSCG-928-I21]|nr:T9SS type A sorting domain-containing protein [Bacteroidales bacterium OttesenSCG-928-I21]